MKTALKIAVAGVLASSLGVAAASPSARITPKSYLFDYPAPGITVMVPKCEATNNRPGCASSEAEALLLATRVYGKVIVSK